MALSSRSVFLLGYLLLFLGILLHVLAFHVHWNSEATDFLEAVTAALGSNQTLAGSVYIAAAVVVWAVASLKSGML